METSHFRLDFPRSFTMHNVWLWVSAFFSHLLEEEYFLLKAEPGVDLWVWKNVIRSYVFRTVIFGFLLCSWVV